MNVRRALCALTVGLLAATVVSAYAAPRDAQSDAPAITRFLSLGFANAATNFSSIRGQATRTVAGIQQYAALKVPDRALLHDCYIGHLPGNGDVAESYLYACRSSARSLSYEKLFETARRMVRAALPPSYAGAPPQGLKDSMSESWIRRGYPEVHLLTYTNAGSQHYVLFMYTR